MRILGIDPGVTQAGFAIYDPGSVDREAGIVCFSHTSEGKNQIEKIEHFSRHLAEVFLRWRPEFLVFERALEFNKQQQRKADLGGARSSGPVAGQLLLPALQGSMMQAAIDRGLPFEAVWPATWRSTVLGTGAGSWPTDRAKAAARAECARMQIRTLNHNECEAALIAWWASRCSQIYKARQYGLAV